MRKVSRPRTRDRDRNRSRPRPETFETETKTETQENGSRDTSRDRDQVSRLHHWPLSQEFAREHGTNDYFCVSMTSPCSLNRSTTFLQMPPF